MESLIKITEIIVHQRSWRICNQSGFISFFDAPRSQWSWVTDSDPDHLKGMHLKGLFTQASFVAATRCNFFALKLQLQSRTCKQGVIFSAICCCDVTGVSKMFETWRNFSVTKIALSYRDKNHLCKWVLRRPLVSSSRKLSGGITFWSWCFNIMETVDCNVLVSVQIIN